MNSYLRVLRHRDFRLLFLGQSASMIGDRVVVVAIALFITQTTGSATDLSIVLAAQSLPLVGLLLFGGVWADRLPRHRIIISTDLVRAGLHALLAVLIFSGVVRIWQLVLIEAAFGAAQAFFQPAYSGLIPQTVPEGLIQEARALTESVEDLAYLLGPALATALVLGIGAWEAFAFDACTFIVSALLLARVNPRSRGEESESGPLLAQLRGGWREVRSRIWVWATIAGFAGAVLFVYAPWYALAPVIARDTYGGAGVFGLVESVAGGGAVIGAICALRWRPRRPLRAGLLMVLAWPVMDASFALHAPIEWVVVCALATGFGFALMVIWWETALARHIPASALSRVSSYDWMGSLALLPLGYALAGPLANALGAQHVLLVGSLIGLVMLVITLLPRETRELGNPPEPGEQAITTDALADVT
jgi:MFS family permease